MQGRERGVTSCWYSEEGIIKQGGGSSHWWYLGFGGRYHWQRNPCAQKHEAICIQGVIHSDRRPKGESWKPLASIKKLWPWGIKGDGNTRDSVVTSPFPDRGLQTLLPISAPILLSFLHCQEFFFLLIFFFFFPVHLFSLLFGLM